MNQKVKFREKLAYGIGDAGCNFVWTVVGSFLTLYYTDNVGLAAAAVGTLMLLTRLLDGCTDLLMGSVIDHTHTRWGKARPWILWSAPFMAISLILLFNVPGNFSSGGKLAYAYITYIFLAAIVYTACNLSYCTLLSLITQNQQERTSLSSVRFFCTMVAVIFISYMTMNFVGKFGWNGTSVIFGIISMSFLFITFFGTKERTAIDTGNKKKSSPAVLQSFTILFKNKYFIRVALLFIINYAAMGASSGIGIYYARDVLGNAGIFGTLTLAGLIPVIVGLTGFPKAAERFGKWKCMMAGYLLQAAGLAIIMLLPTNIIAVIIGVVIKGIGSVPHTAGLFALVADVVDYGEWKTGVRLDGLTYSSTSFGMKVGTGLGSAIVGWGLAFGHYDSTAAIKSASSLAAIKALYASIPFVLIIIGIIVLYFTNIDKIYPVISRELAERHSN